MKGANSWQRSLLNGYVRDPLERETRWRKAARALKKEEQVYGKRLDETAKKRHTRETFYALADHMDAAVLSALVEMVMEAS